MASVFKPLGSDGHVLCLPANEGDYARIPTLLNGASRREGWTPLSMRLIWENNGETLRASDSPWLGADVLLFTARAIDALGAVLDQYGELLPMQCPGVDIWAYNVTHVLDALDEKASSIRHFADGRMMMISRPVFRPDLVQGSEIFKLPGLRASSTHVTQTFVDRWKASGLTGLTFVEVWRQT